MSNTSNKTQQTTHTNNTKCFSLFLEILVLLWGSVAVSNLTLDSRIVFSAITYAHIIPEKTLPALYHIFVWSLNCLASGVYPTHDHEGKEFSATYHPKRASLAGTPLANGYRGIWAELRGDWKWQVEALALDRSYLRNACCHLCRAHKTIRRLWYTQTDQASILRRTCVSNATFRDWQRRRPVGQQTPFLNIIGFNIWCCIVDAMHTLDLGVYQSLFASGLLFAARQNVWAGANLQEMYSRAYMEYRAWCRGKRLAPCPHFVYSKMCTSGEFPTLTQQQAKGAQTKHLMLWLFTIFDAPGFVVDDDTAVVWHLFKQWSVFELICTRNTRFMEPADIPSLCEAAENAMRAHRDLFLGAVATEQLLWQITPKFHMITHMVYDGAGKSVLNPRRTTNYSDEDMVGRIKRIVSSCHGATAGVMSMHRYIILAGMRWWHQLGRARGIM